MTSLFMTCQLGFEVICCWCIPHKNEDFEWKEEPSMQGWSGRSNLGVESLEGIERRE